MGGQTAFEVRSRGVREILARLAEYEDTGLTPEEICKIRADIDAGYMKSIARTYGIDITRMKELAKADRDGCVVILPCKVGDTVYRIFNPQGRDPVISAHTLMSVDYIVRWLDKFGKTVFLTREEAEEALRRSKNG